MIRRYGFLLIGLSIIFNAMSWSSETNPPTLKIGASAPDFTLPGVDGKTYSLKDFAGAKYLMIIFTCNHCPTAQAYENRIKQLVADYKNKGVAFVAISPNDPLAVRLDELGYTDLSDSFDEMKIRAKQREYNYPYLYDGETQKTALAYGPTATPHVFLFDAERKLRYTGRIDDSEQEARVKVKDTRNALDALLAGKPAPVETTKTFGCSIKWAEKRESAKQSLQKWAAEPVACEPINEENLKALVKNNSNKLRLINIWATWCGPCMVEFPELVTINRMYRNRAFEFIAVSADEPDFQGKVLTALQKNEASNKNYHFNSTDKYKLIEAVDSKWPGALPHTLLVRPGGEIVYRQTGEIDPLELKRAIVKNLAEDR